MSAAGAMEDLMMVWDNGATLPWDRPGFGEQSVEDLQGFKAKTEAKKVVQLRWRCEGLVVECRYPSDPLPDRTGVILTEYTGGREFCGKKYLHVVNADGTPRLDFHAPIIDERSIPDKCEIIRLMPIKLWNMPLAVVTYDGYRDLALDVEWATGNVKRWMSGAGLDRY